MGEIFCEEGDSIEQSRSLFDEWLLGKIIAQTLVDMDLSPEKAQEFVALLKIMIAYQNWFDKIPTRKKISVPPLETWLKDPEIQEYLRVNRYEGVLWFNKEAFDKLTRGLLTIAISSITTQTDLSDKEILSRAEDSYKIIKRVRKAGKKSGYQVAKLLENAKAINL